ncbi:MAG: putative 26S proteasome regulatory subunit [Cirrosporium novae-zelandiae]|nr:MAG: putative 26S proteasome regulatory subunit [Cirrosporium novae-zelandiae]
MGIPMDDIHAPTVVSGPTSAARLSESKLDKLSLMELMAEKDKVEGELKALGSVLDSHGVNMNTTLTTFDGYPRADLDIAQIRTTRARIICLRNDYNELMSRIEKGLHAHYASLHETQSNATNASSNDTTQSAFTDSAIVETPFAKVNSVVDGSPADEAGLKAGDGIRKFGNVNWLNHEKLTKVAEIVQHNEGYCEEILLTAAPASDTGKSDKKQWGYSARTRAAINPTERLGRARNAWMSPLTGMMYRNHLPCWDP